MRQTWNNHPVTQPPISLLVLGALAPSAAQPSAEATSTERKYVSNACDGFNGNSPGGTTDLRSGHSGDADCDRGAGQSVWTYKKE